MLIFQRFDTFLISNVYIKSIVFIALLYLLDLLVVVVVFCLFFFGGGGGGFIVGCQQTQQIVHVMSLKQEYISKGKVTCHMQYFYQK